ncbi:MAG: hypothetical protein Fur0037_05490 [Planctomycetota bacterium]
MEERKRMRARRRVRLGLGEIALALLGLALIASMIRVAWIGDDAYITLRTVENFVQGRGLVWNPGARVMTYTHPLWLLVLAFGRILSGECYLSTIGLSIGLSILALGLLVDRAEGTAGKAAMLMALLASRALIDYTTSGLETPLLLLLIVLLARAGSRDLSAGSRTTPVLLLAGLLVLTRMDMAFLVAPLCLACWRVQSLRSALGRTLAGFAPFLAWTAFATFYYGTPFSTTAHAKLLDVGLPAGDLARQGLYYLLHTLKADPATAAVVLAGIAIGFARGRAVERWLAAGASLHLLYVIRVGGDFMEGRFLVPAFAVSAGILAARMGALSGAGFLAFSLAAVLLAVLSRSPPLLTAPSSDAPPTEVDHGIIDERLYYYRNLGLLSPKLRIPAPGGVSAALRSSGRLKPIVDFMSTAGVEGFQAGDLVYCVDPWICDPVLTRLPVWDETKWRIGHFPRALPEGYLETLVSSRNRIRHEGLARFYDAWRFAACGPLFDRERLAAVFGLLTGRYSDGLSDYIRGDYRSPPTVEVEWADVAGPSPDARSPLFWFDHPRGRPVLRGGLLVRLSVPRTAASLSIMANGEVAYRIAFERDGAEAASALVDASKVRRFEGLKSFDVALPKTVGSFDAIRIGIVDYSPLRLGFVGGLVMKP